MKKKSIYLILCTLCVISLMILSGCKSKNAKDEKENAAIEESEEDEDEDDQKDLKDNDKEEEIIEEEPVKEEAPYLSESMFWQKAVGTYLYHGEDEFEDRIFEIRCIDGKYYIEYIGDYDYAAAEIDIVREAAVRGSEDMQYTAMIYPYSGFSFAGDYWGMGYECIITVLKNGDVEILQGQPFLGRQTLFLERTEDEYTAIHPAALKAKRNRDAKDIIGGWKCMSERDGQTHEIYLEFAKNGMFYAVDKVQNFAPEIYIGSYTAEKKGDEIEGDILCELVGYGIMPYEWIIRYDKDLECPIVLEDYTVTEPFTYREGDILEYKKTEPGCDNKYTMGPGERGEELDKQFKEIIND